MPLTPSQVFAQIVIPEWQTHDNYLLHLWLVEIKIQIILAQVSDRGLNKKLITEVTMTNSTLPARTPEGYLCDYLTWNEAIATHISCEEQLELTDAHWAVIRFFRQFYLEYRLTPPMRVLTKALAPELGESSGLSVRLQLLFPGGLAKQASKLAGLPKPVRCI